MASSHSRHLALAAAILILAAAVGAAAYYMLSQPTAGEGEGEAAEAPGAPAGGEGTLEVGPREGMLAPPFTLETLDGRMVSLEDYGGEKAVILWFMVPVGCPICKSQAPDIVRVYEDYMGSVEVIVVTILDYEGVEEDLMEFARAYGRPEWVYALDPGDLALKYDIYEMGVIVIGPDGVVKLRAIPSAGYEELRAAVEEALAALDGGMR